MFAWLVMPRWRSIITPDSSSAVGLAMSLPGRRRLGRLGGVEEQMEGGAMLSRMRYMLQPTKLQRMCRLLTACVSALPEEQAGRVGNLHWPALPALLPSAADSALH